MLVGLVESCIVADVDARPGTQALLDSIYAAWTPFVTDQHGTQCDTKTREERLQWNCEFRVARLTKKDDYRVGLAVGNFPNLRTPIIGSVFLSNWIMRLEMVFSMVSVAWFNKYVSWMSLSSSTLLNDFKRLRRRADRGLE